MWHVSLRYLNELSLLEGERLNMMLVKPQVAGECLITKSLRDLNGPVIHPARDAFRRAFKPLEQYQGRLVLDLIDLQDLRKPIPPCLVVANPDLRGPVPLEIVRFDGPDILQGIPVRVQRHARKGSHGLALSPDP